MTSMSQPGTASVGQAAESVGVVEASFNDYEQNGLAKMLIAAGGKPMTRGSVQMQDIKRSSLVGGAASVVDQRDSERTI